MRGCLKTKRRKIRRADLSVDWSFWVYFPCLRFASSFHLSPFGCAHKTANNAFGGKQNGGGEDLTRRLSRRGLRKWMDDQIRDQVHRNRCRETLFLPLRALVDRPIDCLILGLHLVGHPQTIIAAKSSHNGRPTDPRLRHFSHPTHAPHKAGRQARASSMKRTRVDGQLSRLEYEEQEAAAPSVPPSAGYGAYVSSAVPP